MCYFKKVIHLVYNAVKTVWQLHMIVLTFYTYILTVFSTHIYVHINLTKITRSKNDIQLYINLYLHRYGTGCFLLMNTGTEVCGKVNIIIISLIKFIFTSIKLTLITTSIISWWLFLSCWPFAKAVESKQGLLTTVGYQLGKNKPVVYALEGAVAIAGACVRWLRDNLGVIKTSEEVGKAHFRLKLDSHWIQSCML